MSSSNFAMSSRMAPRSSGCCRMYSSFSSRSFCLAAAARPRAPARGGRRASSRRVSTAAFEALMWPGAGVSAGVWLWRWWRWSGAASTGVPGVLRLAGGTGPVPGCVDWRLPSWSDVCAAAAYRFVGAAVDLPAPELFFSVRGVAHASMVVALQARARPLEAAWIIQNGESQNPRRAQTRAAKRVLFGPYSCSVTKERLRILWPYQAIKANASRCRPL